MAIDEYSAKSGRLIKEDDAVMNLADLLSPTKLVQKATGAGAIAGNLAPGVAFRLILIRLHLSAAGGAGDLTIDVDAALGAAYDSNLVTKDMTLVKDLVYIPDDDGLYAATDEIDVVWANAGTKTYGLEFIYSLQ
jgi:hypothetical protein